MHVNVSDCIQFEGLELLRGGIRTKIMMLFVQEKNKKVKHKTTMKAGTENTVRGVYCFITIVVLADFSVTSADKQLMSHTGDFQF